MSGFIVVLFILAIALPFALAHTKKRNRAWSEAALQLGLSFTPGGFLQGRRLVGRVAGMQAVVDTFSRGSGKNSTSAR